jgi:X-X-X-Leu-X-X-Gly heptad repeat protein
VDVTLTIPGITDGALGTGSPFYTLSAPSTATFGGTVALVNNGTATTLTIGVTTLSGGATALSSGSLAFKPATTIKETGGIAAAGTFTTSGTFRLF